MWVPRLPIVLTCFLLGFVPTSKATNSNPCQGALLQSDRFTYETDPAAVHSKILYLLDLSQRTESEEPPSLERESPDDQEVFLWSDRAGSTFNPPLETFNAKSAARMAHLLRLAEEEGRSVRLVDVEFRNGRYATVPRIRFRDLVRPRGPNMAGIIALGTISALLLTPEARGLGLFLLAVLGGPAIPQLTYLMTRDRDPRVFSMEEIEKKIREISHYLKTGSWIHIGLNYSHSNPTPGGVIQILTQIEGQKMTDLDYWYDGVPEKTELVKQLRSGAMLPLEQLYEFGRSTFDLFLYKTRRGRVRVMAIVTHPENA